MGKWSEYRRKLERLPVDAEYQAKVDEVGRRFKGLSQLALGRAFSRAKLAKRRLEDKVYLMNVELEALTQALVRWFEDNETDQFRLSSGVLISLRDDVYPAVEDQRAFFRWIKLTGSTYLLSVHPKRLESLVKDRLEKGEKVPPGIKTFFKTSISRKGKFEKENNTDGNKKDHGTACKKG